VSRASSIVFSFFPPLLLYCPTISPDGLPHSKYRRRRYTSVEEFWNSTHGSHLADLKSKVRSLGGDLSISILAPKFLRAPQAETILIRHQIKHEFNAAGYT
jgi:hypothetical protein